MYTGLSCSADAGKCENVHFQPSQPQISKIVAVTRYTNQSLCQKIIFFRCKRMILKLIHVFIVFEPLPDYFPFLRRGSLCFYELIPFIGLSS